MTVSLKLQSCKPDHGLFVAMVVIAALRIDCMPALAAAVPLAAPPYQIELPEGYLAPVEHIDGTSHSKGFRKPYAGTALNTVILITVHEFGPSFERRLAKERAQLTRETLSDIVDGIERNRGGFQKTPPRTVTIAGRSGLRMTWTGTAQGVSFNGVVYCVLAGTRAYAVQIQDPAGRGDARIQEAVRAVERMRIAR